MVFTKKILSLIINFFLEKKAKDIWACEFLPSGKFQSLYDYAIVVTSQSYMHQKVLAKGIPLLLKPYNISLKSPFQCTPQNDWILLDYDELFIFIFTKKARDYYNVEDLWLKEFNISVFYSEKKNSEAAPSIYD